MVPFSICIRHGMCQKISKKLYMKNVLHKNAKNWQVSNNKREQRTDGPKKKRHIHTHNLQYRKSTIECVQWRIPVLRYLFCAVALEFPHQIHIFKSTPKRTTSRERKKNTHTHISIAYNNLTLLLLLVGNGNGNGKMVWCWTVATVAVNNVIMQCSTGIFF